MQRCQLIQHQESDIKKEKTIFLRNADAENRTQGCLVGSANATSVQSDPPTQTQTLLLKRAISLKSRRAILPDFYRSFPLLANLKRIIPDWKNLFRKKLEEELNFGVLLLSQDLWRLGNLKWIIKDNLYQIPWLCYS